MTEITSMEKPDARSRSKTSVRYCAIRRLVYFDIEMYHRGKTIKEAKTPFVEVSGSADKWVVRIVEDAGEFSWAFTNQGQAESWASGQRTRLNLASVEEPKNARH
jgi:hypothetical protein